MAASDQDMESWLALIRVPGLGPVLAADLLARCGSPQAVFKAGRSLWSDTGASERVIEGLAAPDWSGVEADLQWLQVPNHHFLPVDHPAYPAQLKEMRDPPLGLFCLGDAETLSMVQFAMVGSRNPSLPGEAMARDFAATLSRQGLVITSGLAQGIDAASHQGALQADGVTLAVCGTGLDRVYPAQNRELAHAIAEQGALISEFPPGTPPRRHHFPRRNRIISGLCLGVLVVEAARKSGSLITARLAMEQGREVFAIPGSIHNPLARGCHRLIREGAKLVESADDILEELAPQLPIVDNAASQPAEKAADQPRPALDNEYRQLLDAMGFEPVHLDDLVDRTGLTTESVSSMLLILELQGLVSTAPGGSYTRIRD